MVKYINAKDLLNTSFENSTTDSVLLKKLVEIVNKMPSANVVEVVRCKDCKHNIISNGRYCVFGDCSGCLVADDFFCKNGEKKETE